MKRLLLSLFSLTLLAGCGTMPAATLNQAGETSAQAQFKTTIVGTVAESKLIDRTVLTMSLEAKRPLLKNVVQPSTFYRFMDKETRRWRGASSGSRLYLAKDGGIYISSGPTDTELWYKVGTYQMSQLRVGFPVNYVLDGEHAFEISGGYFHLNIFHPYKTRMGSEFEWSETAPALFEVK